jgi:hypothetical protein
MPYQIYRIGEWERVGGVDGYSTIRAYLQPGLYETEAYARKKAARLADRIARTAATEAFRSLRSVKARSTSAARRSVPGGRPIRTSSISTTAPSEETAMIRKTEDVPRPPRRIGRANTREAKGRRYSAEAVQREIARDRRIKPKEARLIHALLRGWRGCGRQTPTAKAKEDPHAQPC